MTNLIARKNPSRLGSRRNPAQLETLESRLLLSALPPASLTGDTLLAFQTGGTGVQHSPPGGTAFHFVSSSSVNVQDFVSPSSPNVASYTYSVTGPNTATIVGQSNGTHTLTLTFSTAMTGTFHEVDPDGTQDSVFVLYPASVATFPPNVLSSQNILLNIEAGGNNFPTSGSFRLLTASAGDTYTLTGLTSNINNSTGSYSYAQQVDGVSDLTNVAYNDSRSGPGNLFMAFTAANTGVFYNTDAQNNTGGSDFSVGTFSLSPAATSAQLAFIPQPGSATTGTTVSPGITVQILDSHGDRVATDNSNVTLSIASGPGAVSGTLTVAAVDGVATFSDLSFPTAGTYTINAVDGGLTGAVSHPFVVFAPAALTTFLIARDPSGGGATVYEFQVKFSDPAGVVGSSLTAPGTVMVTGPNGFFRAATFVSVDQAGNGATRTATYQIIINNGATWSPNQEGVYTVSLAPAVVTDTNGARAVGGLVGHFFYSFNPLFSERYYLTQYPDIYYAVIAGTFTSGYQHYQLYGQAEGRNPSSFFNEAFYLKKYPLVGQAVAAGQFKSGFEHFVQYGAAAGYQPSLLFSQDYYLLQYPGVAAAIQAGAFSSALEHFLISGQYEGFNPSIYFDTSFYLSHNTDVAAAIANGQIASPFEHFLDYGLAEGRNALDAFDETYYLAHNADVAAAVTAGVFLSGYAHYITNGQFEVNQTGPATYVAVRIPSTLFDPGYYLTTYPDVGHAVFVDHSFQSAFFHYLWTGRAEGRVGHA